MSEWYENKTIEQLDGKRVRVEYNNGSAIEGKLYKDGNSAAISFGMFGTRSALYKHGGVFEKVSDCIESVTLLDDDDMTRIDDINDVRAGDTFVGTDGQQFKILCVNSVDEMYVTKLQFGKVELWMDRRYFAYALRPSPQLPTEPGLYGDTGDENHLWRLLNGRWEALHATVDDYAYGDLNKPEEMQEQLDGATLYPVEIKRVES